MGSGRPLIHSGRVITPRQLAQLKTRLQAILDVYVKHRPHVQRALTAGFVAYCLGTTWMSLTGRGARGGTRERGGGGGKKGKGKGKGVDGGCFLSPQRWGKLWRMIEEPTQPNRAYELPQISQLWELANNESSAAQM